MNHTHLILSCSTTSRHYHFSLTHARIRNLTRSSHAHPPLPFPYWRPSYLFSFFVRVSSSFLWCTEWRRCSHRIQDQVQPSIFALKNWYWKVKKKERRCDAMRCDSMGVSSKLNELRAITQWCKNHTTLHHTTCLRERTWKTIKWRVQRWMKLGKKTKKNRLRIVRRGIWESEGARDVL